MQYRKHRTRTQTATRRTPQRGITLLEALVAIVVAALGVLAVLGSQMRALSDSHNSVRRAQAIRLTEDLSERLRANPNASEWMRGMTMAPNGTIVDWMRSSSRSRQPKPAPECNQGACDAEKLIKHDLAHWQYFVGQHLPGGDARIFFAHDGVSGADNKTQLGVLIAWREKEMDNDPQYTDPLNVVGKTRGSNDRDAAQCLPGKTCHLQYIALPMRCYPALENSSSRLLCPDTTQ